MYNFIFAVEHRGRYLKTNVGIQTVLVTIDFHWILLTIKINRDQNGISFQTYMLFSVEANLFFYENLKISHSDGLS